jgi:hypothetical protein
MSIGPTDRVGMRGRDILIILPLVTLNFFHLR